MADSKNPPVRPEIEDGILETIEENSFAALEAEPKNPPVRPEEESAD
ncbi:hypothetical protein [Spirosoma endbachense]|uniref:Uncharacterized protein n=1 Tax=Spirosoma endbachense TaxID=2666025 RepID=A0A6P1W6F4_9BACT|nr:hypothetical protein [Spirosoma endbachense]QHW00596.1 hypothetical protein GJR95_38705 [Spirosoma endbachense]